MNKAEVWLGERMTVRRWLAAIGGAALAAVLIALLATLVLRSNDADMAAVVAAPVPASSGGAGAQRPTSVCIAVNVGSVGILDGRANVELDVYPMRLPIEWAVNIRTIPGTGTAVQIGSVREVELNGGETRTFGTAVADQLRNPVADHRRTVGRATIRTVPVAPGEFQYEIKDVGTIRLDADGMSDLKRMLDRAESQLVWLVPRTAALRSPDAAIVAGPAVVPTTAEQRLAGEDATR